MSRRLVLAAVAPLALALAAATSGACSNDAVGVDSCKKIEEARCDQAPKCPMIQLGQPLHRDPDVEACKRFYDVACLHGLEVSADPGPVAVNACVAAINTGNCDTVVHPESDPACAWLIPPPPTPAADAGSDVAADAPADAPAE
jgi:hypothetical protein